MLFKSLGEINRFRKEINRLLTKGMSNTVFTLISAPDAYQILKL